MCYIAGDFSEPDNHGLKPIQHAIDEMRNSGEIAFSSCRSNTLVQLPVRHQIECGGNLSNAPVGSPSQKDAADYANQR